MENEYTYLDKCSFDSLKYLVKNHWSDKVRIILRPEGHNIVWFD